MTKAAAAARAVDRKKLADLLDAEIELYRSSETTVSRRELYDSFMQAVELNPTVTFGQAKRQLATDMGMSLRRVDQAFPRLRKCYAAARSSPMSRYLIDQSSTKTG
ncbi:MAG TPA: hypothetical protein VGE52_06830 [Pirellulales bacterium]